MTQRIPNLKAWLVAVLIITSVHAAKPATSEWMSGCHSFRFSANDITKIGVPEFVENIAIRDSDMKMVSLFPFGQQLKSSLSNWLGLAYREWQCAVGGSGYPRKTFCKENINIRRRHIGYTDFNINAFHTSRRFSGVRKVNGYSDGVFGGIGRVQMDSVGPYPGLLSKSNLTFCEVQLATHF